MVPRWAQTIPASKPYVGGYCRGKFRKLLAENKKVHDRRNAGHFLSLYHGTYPYVTFKKTQPPRLLVGDVGVGPTQVDDVIVIFKDTLHE